MLPAAAPSPLVGARMFPARAASPTATSTAALLGSSLKAWLDERAQDLTDGRVSAWGDQSPTATQDFAQATAGARPGTGRVINGFSALEFDALRHMTGPAKSALMSASAYWVCAVLVLDAVVTSSVNYYANEALLSDVGQYVWASFRNNGGAYTMGAGHGDGAPKTVTAAVSLGTPFLFEWYYDGASIGLRVGAGAASELAAGPVASLAHTTRLGANNGATSMIDGAVGALVVCNAVPSASARAAVRSFLGGKYAVAS